MKKHKHPFLRYFLYITIAGTAIAVILFFVIQVPSIETFSERQVVESTKIYDRTGEVLLWELYDDERRTVVPLHEISRHLKNAVIAIEDENFYSHRGISPVSMFRGIILGVLKDGRAQGGSTITQQLVKNTVLDPERTVLRKIREAIVSVKLEQKYSKDQILELYLNEIPFGSNIYGSESATQNFFGKSVGELSIAESAYLAALPKAPTYFSPYGNNREALEVRKNVVLGRMYELGFITEEELMEAKEEHVTFLPPADRGIRAPHFVMYVRELLNEQFDEQYVARAGLKVITTIDINLQEQAEEIVARYAEINEEKFNASNAALLSLDPKTGEILTMVGSRDFFDVERDGNFNVTLAHRQPGSAFKPIVYATAFEEGYTPETVVFDLPTEFAVDGADSYTPQNYDNEFRGPITLREALAQSINVPAVKLLYLTGIRDALNKARDLGISSLDDSSRFGLSLVLGGGEVSPLELASAYTAFPTGGIRTPHTAILKIEDSNGNLISEHRARPERVLNEYAAHSINSILTDNESRAPSFGFNSPLYFTSHDVGAKTGTTNDFRDAWTIGYSTNFVTVAWAGNNDNTSMEKRVAGFIITPLWREFMDVALSELGGDPLPKNKAHRVNDIKPVLDGEWRGSESYEIDKISGKLATAFTPIELRERRVITAIHNILHWVDKNNPRGKIPESPQRDPQYWNWEIGVEEWREENGFGNVVDVKPTQSDDVHLPEYTPRISLTGPSDTVVRGDSVQINLSIDHHFPLEQIDVFVNGEFLKTTTQFFDRVIINTNNINKKVLQNKITVRVYDNVRNRGEEDITITIVD